MILTAEGLRLPLTIASRGSRAAALLIDLVMIIVLLLIARLVLTWIARGVGFDHKLDTHAGNDANGSATLQTLTVIWIFVAFLARGTWFLWSELGQRGATPGKRMTGIRIAARPGRDGTATRLTAEAVIARNLLREIELFMPFIFIAAAVSAGSNGTLAGWAALVWFGLFALFPFFNRDALRCGDVIAGTWVVEAPRRKLDDAMSVTVAAGGTSAVTGASYRFSDAELAIYGEYELQVLERVLREDRDKAINEVTETICGKIGWTAGAGDERAFLTAYYTQLRARLETGMRLGQRKADKFAARP